MASKKEFKMNLLNAEEMKGVQGGAAVGCSKAGDTIVCDKKNDQILCATHEHTCSPSIVQGECGGSVYSIGCMPDNTYASRCIAGYVASVGASPIAVVAPLSMSAISVSAPMLLR